MNVKINLNDLEKIVTEMVRCRDNKIDSLTDDITVVFDGIDTVYFRQACAYSDGLPRVFDLKSAC